MLDREWVSILDPDEPHDRYVFDVSFLLSNYQCIYGAGCPGTDSSKGPTFGCCTTGAHYMDADEQQRIEAMVDELGPEYMQFYAEARRNGVSARSSGGGARTRIKDGGCIFLNRGGWKRGAGCAFHHYAMDRGEHHMTHKPEVCWIVPLRRLVREDVAEDGETMYVTTITSYDRGAWGPGGADFDWWCMDTPAGPAPEASPARPAPEASPARPAPEASPARPAPEASPARPAPEASPARPAPEGANPWVGDKPVYRSMEHELRAMTSEAVYEELASYLDDRWDRARKPLPFPVFVVSPPRA